MKEPKIPIHIEQFAPERVYDSVLNSTMKSGLLPLKDRRIINLIKSAKEKPADYFIVPEGQKMVEDVSQCAYQRLDDFFELCCREDNRNETAYSSYRKYMGIANEAVHSLIEELARDQKSRFTPKNTIDFIPEPGDVVKLLSMKKGEIDEVYRFEVARQVLLALTAAQLETQTYELSKRLNDVQLLVDTKIFNHGQPLASGKDVRITYLADPITNEVVFASSAQANPPLEDAKKYVVKSTPISMRNIPGDIGQVHTDPRFKADGTALNKVVREALRNQLEGKDGTITAKSISDAAGMRFIVANEFSTNGKNVLSLIELFKETLHKQYGESVSFVEQENNKGKKYQSEQFKTRKLYVKFTDGITLEVMFLGIGDYLNNENRIGNINPMTSLFDGQAHTLYSANRDSKLMEIYFPKALYGIYDEQEMLSQAHLRIAQELLQRDRQTAATRRNVSSFYEQILASYPPSYFT